MNYFRQPKKSLLEIYFKEVSQYKILTLEEELELGKMIYDNINVKQAKEKLIKANLRLVIKIARKFMNRGLSWLELIEEGNYGLIKAVTKYDYRYNIRFGTYASWWIHQSIMDAVCSSSRILKIPMHIYELIKKCNIIEMRIANEKNRIPTIDEIAEALNVKKTKIIKIKKISNKIFSINEEVPNTEIQFEDLISDFSEDSNPLEKLINEDNKEMLLKSVDSLSDRERAIIIKRYGLNGSKFFTLKEIAKEFGISRERVRQIQKKALYKLKERMKKQV